MYAQGGGLQKYMELPSYRYSLRLSRHRRVFIWRLSTGALAVLLIMSIFFGIAANHKQLPKLRQDLFEIPGLPAEAIQLPWPNTGQAAIGTADSGVLASSMPAEAVVPIASVAKVVTALAVMHQKPFAAGQTGATLKLDNVDTGYYDNYVAIGGSVTTVNYGEEISEYDALQALLLPSSNNMADSLARWAFGSLDAFSSYSNAMLKTFGLTKTHIEDASGFSPLTVGTPSELVILGQKLLSNEVLRDIVAKKDASIPVAGTITNVNNLLSDPAIIGIKTGNTDAAGGCLLFAAKHTVAPEHEVTIIGAITGSASISAVFNESATLLNASYAGFGQREIIKAGTIVGHYNSAWGNQVDIVANQSLTTYGWKGNSLKPVINLEDLTTLPKSGKEVGVMNVANGIHNLSVRLSSKNSMPPPTFTWRIRHYF